MKKTAAFLFLSFVLSRAVNGTPPLAAPGSFAVALLFPGVEYSPEMAGMFEGFKDILPPEKLHEMEARLATMAKQPLMAG